MKDDGKRKGNMSGKAKLPANIIKLANNMNTLPPEDDGKVFMVNLSVEGGKSFWSKNITNIPMTLENYKKNPDVYDTWLEQRAKDCVLEIIKQLREVTK